MRIAIDLNDVVRDFSNNFIKYYVDYYNHSFNLDEFELTTNELQLILPFPSDRAYKKFLYQDYSYELYAKCPVCTRNLDAELNDFIEKLLPGIDTEEKIEVIIVSPFEYSLSIGCTYMFLSKIGTTIREVYFPTDSKTIWERCDVLVTANPMLLDNKPEDKITVKIKAEYNKENVADYTYSTFSSFISKEENIEQLLNHNK